MRVSVVVPTYNRPDLLSRCLAALLAQDFDAQEFEIIVADDAASEKTRQLVEWWSGSPSMGPGGPEIRYVAVLGSHGPAAARNTGWHAARGAIIAFTDDDCVPDPHWLTAGMARFINGTQAVRGKIVMPIPDHPTDYQRDSSHLEDAEFVTANCFLRKELLQAVGGFDEQFKLAWREDSDLQFRLMERGVNIIRAGDCIVVHPLRPGPWAVSISQQRKSMYNALLYKKHPRQYRAHIQKSPPFHYYTVLLALLASLVCLAAGAAPYAGVFVSLWALLTMQFAVRRLRGTTHAPAHVAEMLFTSVMIPPAAVYWRLRGAIKFRVFFL